MKNTILKTKLFLMGVCTVFVISCSPEDGEAGAMGQQGIQGEQGPAGQNGVDGLDGSDGQNGVDGVDGGVDTRYTPWFNFEDTTSRTDFFYLNSKTFGFYDRSFIDNGGAVLVYEGYVVTGALNQVPIRPTNIQSLMKRYSSNSFEWEVNYRMESNRIDLTINLLSGSTASHTRQSWLNDIYLVKNHFFRIIFIPGGTAIGAKKEVVDFNDYEAVKKYYNIPD
jgi:hypothetical protein